MPKSDPPPRRLLNVKALHPRGVEAKGVTMIRECDECGTTLGRTNSGDYCWPCKERLDEEGRPTSTPPRKSARSPGHQASKATALQEDVMALADVLLAEPSRWGLMGIEFAFFHQFFNEGLRSELADMRRVLYGQPQPPCAMSLLEAERLFAPVLPSVRDILEWNDPTDPCVDSSGLVALRAAIPLQLTHSIEVIRFLADRLRQAGLIGGSTDLAGRKTIGLHAGLLTLLLPMSPGQVATAGEFWSVARRMRELEEELATATGSLDLALVCGTPPVPTNLKAQIQYDTDSPTTELRLRVYSAKVRDIREAYSMVGDSFAPRAEMLGRTKVQWRWRKGLPSCLEASVSTTNGLLPAPGAMQEAFRCARRGMAFYDSRTKIKDYRAEVEAWAKGTLCIAGAMGNRDALEFWTQQRADALSPFNRRQSTESVTTSAEVVFSIQLKRIRKRVQRLRAMTSHDVPTAYG